MNNWALRFMAAICLALVASCLLPSPNTHAEDGFSWTNSVLITNSSETTPYTGLDEQGRPDWGGGCIYQQVYVGNLATTPNDICIFQGNGFRYGILLEPITFGSFVTYNRSFVIGFSNDTRMYKVQGAPVNRILWTPYSSDIIYRVQSADHAGYDLLIIKNFRSKITTTTNPDFSRGYKMISVHSQLLLSDEEGDGTPVGAVASSLNGRWLAAQIYDKGLVRIDLRDYSKRWFSDYHIPDGVEGSITDLAISAEGNYVAAVGSRISPFMTDLTSGCGRTFTTFRQEWALKNGTPLASPCPERQLKTTFSHAAGGDIDMVQRPSFDRSDTKFTALVSTGGSEGESPQYKEVSISSTTYLENNPRLDYLALGDSYSSGEGDLGKDRFGRKYYRAQTDVESGSMTPEEKCHISTRSYPYLLARSMRLSFGAPKQWDTVACSGAEVKKDYRGNPTAYLGQEDSLKTPRLKNFPNEIDKYRKESLSGFIPGRIQQLQFVERSLPRVITLTGGGNDVGFGKVIEKCASYGKTCDYAASTGGISQIGYGIQRLYGDLVALYDKIHALSPRTKIYVIGYPQFYSDKKDICSPNVLLDKKERTFVRESVIYLNNVIEAAAKSAGVKYIDIENSFNGHVLCGEGDSYVNGANFNCAEGKKYLGILNFFAGTDECQESFHPNYMGHMMIADSIIAQTGGNLLSYSYCTSSRTACPPARPSIPSPTPFFAGAMIQSNASARATYATLASSQYIQKNNPAAKLNIQVGNLQPGSQVRVYMLSEPTELGVYTVDDDGGLSAEIPAPSSVPSGYHTLHIEGFSYSGEPIDLWQIITLFGANGDVDEDGIEDKFDKCQFVAASGVDSDYDAIDDACDLSIDAPSELMKTEAGYDARSDYVADVTSSSAIPQRNTQSRPTGARHLFANNNRSFTSASIIGVCILALVIAALYMIRQYNKHHHKG